MYHVVVSNHVSVASYLSSTREQNSINLPEILIIEVFREINFSLGFVDQDTRLVRNSDDINLFTVHL